MRTRSLQYVLAILAACACVGIARASTTDFESSPTFLNNDPSSSYSIDGLSFSATSYYGVQHNLFLTDNSTNFLVYFAGGGNSLSMAYSHPFNLTSFSFGPSENVVAPDSITVTGYTTSGNTVSKTLSFNAASSLTLDASALVGFNNLRYVVFSPLSSGYGYAWVDNIAVTPVPEPSPPVLFALGLGIIGLTISKRLRPN